MIIENSSKRLAKIKKKLKRNDGQDYKFLLGSLQRESNKQNYTSNKVTHYKASLKNSVQLIKPKTTVMINSFDNYKNYQQENNVDIQNYKEKIKQSSNYSKIKMLKNSNNKIPFFQNVKFLKNSRMLETQEQESQSLKQKCQSKQNRFSTIVTSSKHNIKLKQPSYKKNIELSQKEQNKLKSKSKSKYLVLNDDNNNKKSNKFVEAQNNTQSVYNKILEFISFVNELFQDIFNDQELIRGNKLARKKYLLESLSNELMRQLQRRPQFIGGGKSLHNSIQVSNFCTYNSKTISKELQKSANINSDFFSLNNTKNTKYQQVISNLQQQNTKLVQLISEHESQNIKMFVKMNQSQSKEMQHCKKYLSGLYDKYKQLQKSIKKESAKCKALTQEKQELIKKLEQNQEINKILNSQLQQLRQKVQQNNYYNSTIIQQNQEQSLSKLSFEDQIISNHNTTAGKTFNFTVQNKNQANQNSFQFSKILKPKVLLDQSNQSLINNSKSFVDSNKSYITKRDKASSCLSTHLNKQQTQFNNINKEQEIMSWSTITKTKNNMKKKKQKSIQSTIGEAKTNGINLKQKFNKENNNNIQNQNCEIQNKLNQKNERKVAQKNQGILVLKKQLIDLKLALEQESKQKSCLHKQLEEISFKMAKKQQRILKMQQIINEQLNQIQKLIDANSKMKNQAVNRQKQCIFANNPHLDSNNPLSNSNNQHFSGSNPHSNSFNPMDNNNPSNNKENRDIQNYKNSHKQNNDQNKMTKKYKENNSRQNRESMQNSAREINYPSNNKIQKTSNNKIQQILNRQSEYRIIALQAATIQNYLHFST